MENKKIKKILTEHKKWLNSSGVKGKRAVLRYADLTNADLSGAVLRYADLSGANGILVFGPAPSSGRMLYVFIFNDKLYYMTGCFCNTEKYFVKAVKEKHKKTSSATFYLACVKAAQSLLEINEDG